MVSYKSVKYYVDLVPPGGGDFFMWKFGNNVVEFRWIYFLGRRGFNVKDFQMFLDSIGELVKKDRMECILNNIKVKFPQLKEEIKWNQPMFSDHGTFIIGFSVAKGHIAVAPESVVISMFERDIEEAGYSYTQELFRIKWKDNVDFDLLHRIVDYNIEDKKGMTNFWR